MIPDPENRNKMPLILYYINVYVYLFDITLNIILYHIHWLGKQDKTI